MEEKKKGIGLIGLIGMVISSCIGSGVFAITGQLAGVASPERCSSHGSSWASASWRWLSR